MKVIIVVPVYNESMILEKNIVKLYQFCQANINDVWRIVIANDGSTDETREIGGKLAKKFDLIEIFNLPRIGKGGAVISAWQKYLPEIGIFIDADLAPDLKIIPELINEINQGTDIALGSRYLAKAKVSRHLIRTIVSRVNIFIRQKYLESQLEDLSCGVKAVNKSIIIDILPQVKNRQWFFDTEMVLIAENLNYQIKEVPVIWCDRQPGEGGSRINLIKSIWQYLKEMKRLKKDLMSFSKH